MPDRPRLKLAVALPLSGAGWRPGRLHAVCGRFCRISDLAILTIAFLALTGRPGGARSLGALLQVQISLSTIVVAAMCISTWLMILWSVGVYTASRTRSFADYAFRCVVGLNSCAGVVGLVELVLHRGSDVWRLVEVYWLACLLPMVVMRLLLVAFDRGLRPRLRRTRQLLIVGTGARARQVVEELKTHRAWKYRVAGFIDSEPMEGFVPADKVLGGLDALERLLVETEVDEVVIALPMKSQYEAIGRAIEKCQRLGVRAQFFTDYFGASLTKNRSYASAESGRVVLEVVPHDYRMALKRGMDVAISMLAILLLSPVLLAVALAVKLTSPGPVLYRQKRYGLNRRKFFVLKFRSMCVDAEARMAALEHLNEAQGPAFKIRKDPRITPIGKFLRRMSLDELPQLFNVLNGEMSLVGPRPLSLRDVDLMPETWMMRRFSVKPGISCLWQVMGRSNTDFERWVDLDLQYIDNWSLSLDLLILWKTIPAVLSSNGAS